MIEPMRCDNNCPNVGNDYPGEDYVSCLTTEGYSIVRKQHGLYVCAYGLTPLTAWLDYWWFGWLHDVEYTPCEWHYDKDTDTWIDLMAD